MLTNHVFCYSVVNQAFVWTLGDTPVPHRNSCCHLGIIINDKSSLSDRIKSACRKGRNTFYALTDIGSPYLNPLTLVKLYKSVVLPSALYGCELWNNLSTTDSQQLHVFQHSICKSVQNLPSQTRLDMCESLRNILAISSEIDARKLFCFCRLCRMSCQTLSKQILLIRLFSFLAKQDRFIPDIPRLLDHYISLNTLTSG